MMTNHGSPTQLENLSKLNTDSTTSLIEKGINLKRIFKCFKTCRNNLVTIIGMSKKRLF